MRDTTPSCPGSHLGSIDDPRELRRFAELRGTFAEATFDIDNTTSLLGAYLDFDKLTPFGNVTSHGLGKWWDTGDLSDPSSESKGTMDTDHDDHCPLCREYWHVDHWHEDAEEPHQHTVRETAEGYTDRVLPHFQDLYRFDIDDQRSMCASTRATSERPRWATTTTTPLTRRAVARRLDPTPSLNASKACQGGP